MKNPLTWLSIALLKIYKLIFSPAFSALGIKCRYYPSCSRYGIDAFSQHGFWRGFWLTLSRLYRCQPFGSSGIDPVPDRIHKQPFWAPWRYGDWGGHKRGH